MNLLHWMAYAGPAVAQTYTAIQTITPDNVAFLSYNVSAHDSTPFQIWDPTFRAVLGPNPSLTLLLEAPQPYFHEAGVYYSSDPPTIFSVSNQFNTTYPSPATAGQQIVISKIVQNTASGEWTSTVIIPSPPIPLANGGFPYKHGVLFTAQGTLDTPGGLVYMQVTSASNSTKNSSTPSYSYPTQFLIDNFLGREFNSPNDVYVTRAGDIFFTDPIIGYPQGVRPAPLLPGHVYVFTPGTTQIRVVAEGIPIPNGITLSPDERTAYITTTPLDHNVTAPHTIYAFDLLLSPIPGVAPSFTNKRIFAFVDIGAADGIKTDDRGNVWAGCGDGLNVWNAGGVLLGKIATNGTIANFAFGGNGDVFVFDETRLYQAKLSSKVQSGVAFVPGDVV